MSDSLYREADKAKASQRKQKLKEGLASHAIEDRVMLDCAPTVRA